MAIYVTLANSTDQGIRRLRGTMKRLACRLRSSEMTRYQGLRTRLPRAASLELGAIDRNTPHSPSDRRIGVEDSSPAHQSFDGEANEKDDRTPGQHSGLIATDPEGERDQGGSGGDDGHDQNRDSRPGLAPDPDVADRDRHVHHERGQAAESRNLGEVQERSQRQYQSGCDEEALGCVVPHAAVEWLGQLTVLGEHIADIGGPEQAGVDRRGSRQHGGDRHHGETGPAEHRLGRHGQGGLLVPDHLGHREVAERDESNGQVEDDHAPDGDPQCSRKFRLRLCHVGCGVGDDSKSRVGEKCQTHGRDHPAG